MSYSIIIDTNIVFNDFFFQSTNMKKLLKIARREPIKLCMTKFNYEEILKKYQDEIRPTLKTLKNTKSHLAKHKINGLVNFEDLKVGTHVAKYQEFLDDLIQEYNIKIIEHPTSPEISKRIADRYFQRIKPFDENKLSFQDAFIWESIVDYCEKGQPEKVVFISTNYKDFANSSKDKIHEDLEDDIYPYTEFSYYMTVEDFLKNEEDELKDYFTENFVYDEDNLMTDLVNYLEHTAILESSIDSLLNEGHFQGEYFEGWGTDGYIKNNVIRIENVSQDIEENTMLISFYVDMDIDFSIETTDPAYERGDDGDGFMSKSTSGEAYIKGNITYSPDDGEFTDYVELDSQISNYE
ncbi:PIN domain-containing protein [Peribacillus simplex]|uniref:PIN domain-containing protein n=1 Tax=Peribacillus simplex TaxID=1478 RepID=UPI003670384C